MCTKRQDFDGYKSMTSAEFLTKFFFKKANKIKKMMKENAKIVTIASL